MGGRNLRKRMRGRNLREAIATVISSAGRGKVTKRRNMRAGKAKLGGI